ncbi:MAG: hypothetical protein COA88_08070, partial [Kordia sp.]
MAVTASRKSLFGWNPHHSHKPPSLNTGRAGRALGRHPASVLPTRFHQLAVAAPQPALALALAVPVGGNALHAALGVVFDETAMTLAVLVVALQKRVALRRGLPVRAVQPAGLEMGKGVVAVEADLEHFALALTVLEGGAVAQFAVLEAL